MKSTTSSSSASSRDERSLPKLLVSDSDGVNVLPNPENNKSNEVISRKNSKSSLKSNSSAADVSNMTKDEIIASMIKNRMRELGDCEPETSPLQTDPSHSMTDQTPLLKADAPAPIKSDQPSRLRKYSRSHQRRFHRRFPAVPAGERLIDWFNCALIADILLQGYLYISDNYFAFYSNIFGYKTQFLIPISDVVSVTKEKTAKIFPNAVGICTDEAKYVFGSLLSREAAYRLLQDVWRTTLYQVASDSCHTHMKKMRDSGLTEVSGSCETRSLSPGIAEKRLSISDDDEEDDDESDSRSEEMSIHAIADTAVRPALAATAQHEARTSFARALDTISIRLGAMKRPKNNLFVAAIVALVLLFVSAGFLLLRANLLYSRLADLTADTQILTDGSQDVDRVTGDEDGLWPRAKAAILSWNRVRNFAGKLQVELREVTDLRHELEQLLHVLKAAETPCS